MGEPCTFRLRDNPGNEPSPYFGNPTDEWPNTDYDSYNCPPRPADNCRASYEQQPSAANTVTDELTKKMRDLQFNLQPEIQSKNEYQERLNRLEAAVRRPREIATPTTLLPCPVVIEPLA